MWFWSTQSRFDPLYSNNKREVTKVLSTGTLDVSVSGFDSRLCDKNLEYDVMVALLVLSQSV